MGLDEETRLQLLKSFTEFFARNLMTYGFEIAPFLTGWYNELVAASVRLDPTICPHADCVAMCIISSPKMFEKSFLTHLASWFRSSNVRSLELVLRKLRSATLGVTQSPGLNDPLDWSVLLRISAALEITLRELEQRLPVEQVLLLTPHRFIPDFEMRPVSRLPVVHMQCAGHVSGLAYFHKPDWKSPQNYPGCSLHHRYGGWFGFRGVIVFPSLRCPTLPRVEPLSPILPYRPPFPTDTLRYLLAEFRDHWKANRWRDVGLSEDRHRLYSDAAVSFFLTSPAERATLIEGWFK